MLELLQHGIGAPDVALNLNRVALGVFFAISGYHKLFNKERHASLVTTLKANGIPLIRINQWWVPGVEFMGGLALLSGILAPLAALGLFIVCSVATCTDGYKRIVSYKPIDRADWLDDLLYLPETLYIIGLAIVVCVGPGNATLINLVF